MIIVELPDGRAVEFPEGTSRDVMKRAIQNLMMRDRAQAARAGTLAMQPGSAERAEAANEIAERQMAVSQPGSFMENIIGRGAADTPGERAGELIRGAGAAVARGMADVPALPVNLAQLAATGVEKLFGMEQPSAVSRALAGLPETREMLAAIPVIGPESRYVAPGLAGEYISTAGEFAGGAGAMAGPSAMMRYGVVPGLASEAAGQATEGTNVEPYARMVGAIAAPIAAGAAGRLATDVISPAAGQITPARREAVEALRREGVRPTAGQVTGVEPQRYREAASQAGVDLAEQAAGDFTAAVMRSVGSSATRATPEALMEAQRRLSGVYDDVARGVAVVPDSGVLTKMSEALATYRELAPSASAPPIFANINKAMVRSFRSGEAIANETLMSWRKNLSRLTTSADDATRSAAITAIETVDDAIAQALVGAGRADDVQRLTEARNQYRNLLAIEQAAMRADVEGVISPLALRTALLTQGRRRYVQGRGDLAEITRAASDIMSPLPQSGTQPRLSARELFSGASGGTGVGLGAFGLGLDPVTSTAIGGTAAIMPALRNAFLTSGPGQAYYQNQLLPQFGPIIDRRMIGMVPGLMSNEGTQ